VVKQGLLQQLLTRGIGHTKFKQTEIGEIPESWGVKMLGDVAAFRNGKGHERYIDDKGPFIVVNSKFISTEGAVLKRTEACLSPLSINDIAMVMSDVPKGRALSKCYRITENDCYTLNQRICAFETGEEITSDFLFLVVNRNSYFLRLDDGVGQTNLRRGEVLNCPIPLPSLPEQQAIADILQSVDDFIRAEEERLTQLETLKRGLMQDLLTGKVRVKVS
jgi:type I restriction enzyme, S subunit